MELLNSSIELLADLFSIEKHPTIKKLKGLAAEAVLVSSITAVLIELCIFVLKLFKGIY